MNVSEWKKFISKLFNWFTDNRFIVILLLPQYKWGLWIIIHSVAPTGHYEQLEPGHSVGTKQAHGITEIFPVKWWLVTKALASAIHKCWKKGFLFSSFFYSEQLIYWTKQAVYRKEPFQKARRKRLPVSQGHKLTSTKIFFLQDWQERHGVTVPSGH